MKKASNFFSGLFWLFVVIILCVRYVFICWILYFGMCLKRFRIAIAIFWNRKEFNNLSKYLPDGYTVTTLSPIRVKAIPNDIIVGPNLGLKHVKVYLRKANKLSLPDGLIQGHAVAYYNDGTIYSTRKVNDSSKFTITDFKYELVFSQKFLDAGSLSPSSCVIDYANLEFKID